MSYTAFIRSFNPGKSFSWNSTAYKKKKMDYKICITTHSADRYYDVFSIVLKR